MKTLENIVLSKRSQSQKAIYYMVPFRGSVQNREIDRDRKEINDCLGQEKWMRNRGMAKRYRVSFWGDENCGSGCTYLNILTCSF